MKKAFKNDCRKKDYFSNSTGLDTWRPVGESPEGFKAAQAMISTLLCCVFQDIYTNKHRIFDKESYEFRI